MNRPAAGWPSGPAPRVTASATTPSATPSASAKPTPPRWPTRWTRPSRALGGLAEDPPLFRPYARGGVIDHYLVGPAGAAHLQARGYTCVLWNCLRDWVDADGWVDTCLEQVAATHWPVIVVHDVPGAALARMPELLDRLAGAGASFTQEIPESCTPLRAGRPTSSYARLCVGS